MMSNKQEEIYRQATEGLRRIFQAECTANIDSSIQFSLTGESAVDFYTLIKDQTLTIEPGRMASPRVTMSMEAYDFLAMLTGEISTTDAFAGGKLKVGGNLFYAMKLAPVFKFGDA